MKLHLTSPLTGEPLRLETPEPRESAADAQADALESLWLTFEQDVARELKRVRSEYGVKLDAFDREHYRKLVQTRRFEQAKQLVGRGVNIGELGWRNLARTCPRDWWYVVKIANAYNVGPTRPLGEYEKAEAGPC